MLDLHMTRFIHSWSWLIDMTNSIVVVVVDFDDFAYLLLHTLYSIRYVIFKSSRILSKMLRFFIFLTSARHLRAYTLCFFLLRLIFSFLGRRRYCYFCCVSFCFILKLGWFVCISFLFFLRVVVILFILCAQVLTPFRRSLITQYAWKIVFSLVCACVFLLLSESCGVLTFFSYIGRYVLFIYFYKCVSVWVCTCVCSILYLVVVSFILLPIIRVCVSVRFQMLPMSVLANIKRLFLHISQRLMCKQFAI